MSKQRSTKAEQFNAKIHGLREIFKRLDSRTLPLPTGNDVANYLQWFQDVLQGLVKEERPSLTEDRQRFDIQKYPAMSYVDLFKVLNKMVRVVPNCELGSEAFAKSILSIMASVIPFLPKDHLNSLPMMIVMYLSIWPETFHGYIFNLMCGYVMPIALHILKAPDPPLSYAVLSCPSLLMTVLQYCPDSKQQAQFVETLMKYKTDVCLDIMAVIAYGPQSILNAAGQILLHYYPLGNAGASSDDWQFMYESWYPVKCQNVNCMVPNRNQCVKICFDASYAASACELAPAVFICSKCSELASKEVPNFNHFFLNLLDPLGPVPTKCQGETCKGQGISSALMCFSPECAKRNKNRGTAMCRDCNDRYHSEGEGSKHVVQALIPDPWTMKGCEQAYVTEAVVRLLREAQPCQATRYDDMGLEKDKFRLEPDEEEVDNDINNRRMLSRFGIWLLVGLCGDPSRCESPERLGRLVAMTIEWIDATSSLMRDYVGELLKRLATQRASKWLTSVRDIKMELFCACLSPYPPEYAKVGGCWDSLTSPVRLLIEGLHRMCCLIPYQLVDVEVWDIIMPLWMDAIKTNVPQEELPKFKFLLCKIFDPYLSPYKLPSEISLGFVKKMLEDSTVYSEQVQALAWLQMLSTLEVIIKLHMLISMFIKAIQNQVEQSDGLSTMFPFPSQDEDSLSKRDSMISSSSAASSTGQETPTADTASLTDPPLTGDSIDAEKEAISNLSSFIIMLDLLLKQVQLQRQRENRTLNTLEREEIKRLLKIMLDVSWTGTHGDHSASCQHCEMIAVWFHLAFMLFEGVFPIDSADEETLNTVAYGNLVRSGSSLSKAASFRSTGSRRSVQITETIDEVFDDANDNPSTHASISATDPTGSIAEQPDSEGSQGQGEQPDSNESASMPNINASIGSWRSGTSSATWGAVYDNYPQLQLLIGLLKELPKQQDHIVQLNMLKCVKILVLQGDYLKIAMDAEPDFLAYLQEIFFVPNLWDMIRAEHSNLSEICVEILLHCICLPYGAEKFCDNVESAFTDDDWRVRFAGVEKFTVIARFLDIETIKSNKHAMSALAQSFTYLVGAVEDICTPISTRTIAMLDTIKSSSLKTLYLCIEHQYDAAPKDRLLLIHTCRILHRTLPHYTPLCGQFFIRRFKHLLIENADYVSFGSPKTRSPLAGGGPGYVSQISETATSVDGDGSRRAERWRSQSSSKGSVGRQSRLQDTVSPGRSQKNQFPTFRCSYTFRMAGDKISYNRQTSTSSEGGNSTGGRQRRTGGFSSQIGHSPDVADRMFLGGRIVADNLSIVEEEADSEKADNDSARLSHVSSESTHSQEQVQAAPQDGSDLEAAATHQLVTLVMDFLAYPGAKNSTVHSMFVKTESYEVVQMSHYLGVLMGYDIKVGEFTGDPRRLRLFPVFHAYMSGIVQVLDQKLDWGGELINLTLQLLLFCAAPKSQKRIEHPDFTLIRLSQPMRRTWLMTLLIILYKYPFFQDSHRRDTRNLISVVINTLEAHDHKCPGPRSAINKSKSLSMLDLENHTTDDGTKTDTPGSPRYKRVELNRSSPTYKQRLSTCSTEIAEKDDKDDDPRNQPLMAIHETSFVGPDTSQQKATTSTPLLEFSPGGSRGGSSGALTDEERNAELRPLIGAFPEKPTGHKAQGRSFRGESGSRDKGTYFYNLARRYKSALTSLNVSVDSTTSRDTRESLEGVLSMGADDGRKPSRPKLLTGISMRSMDHSIERSLDKFIESAGDKEPELQDIDLDVCSECGASLEEFDEETLNMAIVVLSTYVHQSPSMAMPYLLRMLECVGRKCVHPMFPWQDRSDLLVPGSNTEVAKQFLRCVLIKLAPNGIFSELFRTTFDDELLLKSIAYALNDYSAFDQMSPIAYLLEDILGFRTLCDRVMLLLTNLSTYFKYASKETTSAWSSQLSHFENFFRKLPSALPDNCDITPAFQIMSCILTAANSSFKELLPPFGQVIAFGINKASFQLQDLLDLCSKCNETFPKERDKLFLTRVVVQEMMQAVRFKSYLPDANLQALLQFLAIDAGSRVTFGGNRDNTEYSLPFGSRTRAMDCIQNYLIEIVEFIRDWHFTSRSSNENKRLSEPNLNLDTIPIDLKAAMSQLAALEFAKQPKSSKLYTKSLTWLKNPPSASQLGPRELQECVSNMRLLTWILQGSLSHIVNSKMAHAACQPIALEENVNVAKYVVIILNSFAEQLKDSLNVTALYHAFYLCELWSLYCDIIKLHAEYSEQSSPIVLEFWAIVTPGILHLLTKSKEMCDLIGHNFLNLLEALQECNCTSLPKLYPMWHSILTFCFSLKGVSEGYHNRLRKAQTRKRANKETRLVISKWLKQLRFKIALVEQSGANGQALII